MLKLIPLIDGTTQNLVPSITPFIAAITTKAADDEQRGEKEISRRVVDDSIHKR
jgi:hypothetical protein